jgi:hypothetical protein
MRVQLSVDGLRSGSSDERDFPADPGKALEVGSTISAEQAPSHASTQSRAPAVDSGAWKIPGLVERCANAMRAIHAKATGAPSDKDSSSHRRDCV